MQTRHQSAGYLPLSASKANTAPEKPPTRVVRLHAGLSFWTITETPRGRAVSSNAFDVPAEAFGPGYVRGQRVFVEFMQALRAHELSAFDAERVIKAAHDAGQAGDDKRPSRRGAANAFLGQLSSAVGVAAQHFDFVAAARQRIADIERCEVFLQNHRARQKVARQAKTGKRTDAGAA